jgi:5-carboxymethyl-2-hydroxymuconate isomerase
MKLLRHGAEGAERPGMLDAGGRARDLSSVVHDIDADALSPPGLARLRALDPATLPPVPEGTRLGPPVAGIGKFVAIGLNYSDHAAEAGMPIPTEPIVFLKATSCVCGPDDDTWLPPDAAKLDWEVELALVIGTRAQRVAEADALAHVAGYCVANDVSERAWQLERLGSWDKGKGHDRFGPLGPWLVTADEVGDPQRLDLWLDLNGERMQSGSTATMVFSCARIVSYVSRFMTLMPGDVITTGTPPGVGMGKRPPRFLQAGDVVELGVQGLGRQRQRVVAVG